MTTHDKDKIIAAAKEVGMPQGASNEFKRESRYVVIKLKDLEAAKLSPREKTDLYDTLFKISIARQVRGKAPLNCVVVESDWPEYEKTWESIEERVKNDGRP